MFAVGARNALARMRAGLKTPFRLCIIAALRRYASTSTLSCGKFDPRVRCVRIMGDHSAYVPSSGNFLRRAITIWRLLS